MLKYTFPSFQRIFFIKNKENLRLLNIKATDSSNRNGHLCDRLSSLLWEPKTACVVGESFLQTIFLIAGRVGRQMTFMPRTAK